MSAPGAGPAVLEPSGDPVGTAVVVPGRAYPPAAPLLFFATQALLHHGWRVHQLWWDPPHLPGDPGRPPWVREQVEAVLPYDGRVLLVAKSLGTLAAPLAAERSLPAVWLTPLLDDEDLVAGVAANPAPQLLVGGTDDPAWDAGVASRLESPTCRLVTIAGADHAMLRGTDVPAGVEAHAEVARAVDAFLTDLA